MQTGAFMESHLVRLVPCVLSLFILTHLCLAAPGQPGTQREESIDARPPSAELANPFGSGEEDRRLLQSFIKSTLSGDQGGPEISNWEQEVFYLFRLYDYDRSGLLDGLEMMRLLSDFNSHHTPGAQTSELQVVSMVDFLLQAQDSNQDGMLAPSELLSPPKPHSQDPGNGDDSMKAEAENPVEAHQELQPQVEEQIHQERIEQVDEQHVQQIPEAPAAEQRHDQPVHQGQPEI
ncbi:cell growth regulator with EF hand domain protein 1 isoform X1 [Acanthopagrus latus]|uniref:cell growth regulator with EF hand domain protein 1 isoform X1 n=1 Tax=Acanthopagrus latus TaxID=8177 RepID=UPI00187BEC1E|nr:cell growth regulator with EF hand domain protein 1 isoform X1 [Acanthopagrus latus]